MSERELKRKKGEIKVREYKENKTRKKKTNNKKNSPEVTNDVIRG